MAMTTPQNGSTPITAMPLYAGAAACCAAALLELRKQVGFSSESPFGYWVIDSILPAACTIVALLVLRSQLNRYASGAILSYALLGLVALYALIPLLGVAGWINTGDAPEVSEHMRRQVMRPLFLLAAILFAYLGFRVRTFPLAGRKTLMAYALLGALGFLLQFAGNMSGVLGGTILAMAYIVLAAYFLRQTRLYPVPAEEGTNKHIHRRGFIRFAVLLLGLSALLAVVGHYMEAHDDEIWSPLFIPFDLLLGPQIRTLEIYQLPVQATGLLLLSLVYLPILLVPVGLRIVYRWPRPLWVTLVLQIVFLLVYLAVSFLALIAGIQS